MLNKPGTYNQDKGAEHTLLKTIIDSQKKEVSSLRSDGDEENFWEDYIANVLKAENQA